MQKSKDSTSSPEAVLGEHCRYHLGMHITVLLVTPFKRLPLHIACQLSAMGFELEDSPLNTTRFKLYSKSNMHPSRATTVFNVYYDSQDEMVEQVGIALRTWVYPFIAKQHREEYNYDDYV